MIVGYNNTPLYRRYSPFETLTRKTSQHCQLSGASTTMDLGTGMPSVLVPTLHVSSPDDALLLLTTIITEGHACTPFDLLDNPLTDTSSAMKSCSPLMNIPQNGQEPLAEELLSSS